MTWTSMTGYGRGESHGEQLSVTVDVRSVNHRYLDLHVRIPNRFMAWEPRIRAVVRDFVRRGKVDLNLNLREWGAGGVSLRVNRSLLSAYLSEARALEGEMGVSSALTFADLVRIPDLFVTDNAGGTDPVEAFWPSAEEALKGALSMLVRSRKEEGANLREVISATLSVLRGHVDAITPLASENKILAVQRFRERIESLSTETGVDTGRLSQEAAYLTDRLDVTEEIDRLRSHLAALESLVSKGGDALGKRFDFLLQELFRELNTAGNKSAHPEISARVVTAKTELEKIREQIQNVE